MKTSHYIMKGGSNREHFPGFNPLGGLIKKASMLLAYKVKRYVSAKNARIRDRKIREVS